MSKYFRQHQENLNNFYTAVSDTRNEGTGVSIKEVAGIFREIFADGEVESLIKFLSLKD